MTAYEQTLDDVAFVDAWFRHRKDRIGSDVQDISVVSVERLTRGVSRQTWSLDALVDGTPRCFIVRRDHETGAVIPTLLTTEYEVYRGLNDAPVPTARALWFEDDPQWQPDHRAAYVREKIAGDWYLPFIADGSPEHDERRIAASKEHLTQLARLHTADWQSLGFGEVFAVPKSPADCAANLIRDNLRRLAEYQFEPSPVLAEGVAQLLESAPRDVPRISLCKGTNGHGEEVWADGRIVAMSDWELACLGDPAYDFAQLQEMVPEIVRDGREVWGWDQALEFYREQSGIDVSLERIHYYRAVNGLLQFLYTHHSGSQVKQLGVTDLRFVWTAWENSFRSNIRLAQEYGFEPEGSAIK
ncbi:phosphotransferase family protein [Rhodococcus sp. JVH1]|uniref:phosphotransferase family protein n=1 Tax=Rhodococcus sp. JVH1 TaxID=745408 RepID=UPI000271EB29|nr:phosphotransferase family protein [Rhodococcus sp. JVH1]EJI93539.1 hypothetical protein JVH1_9088 [Rhodococcus sp. JVH1]